MQGAQRNNFGVTGGGERIWVQTGRQNAPKTRQMGRRGGGGGGGVRALAGGGGGQQHHLSSAERMGDGDAEQLAPLLLRGASCPTHLCVACRWRVACCVWLFRLTRFRIPGSDVLAQAHCGNSLGHMRALVALVVRGARSQCQLQVAMACS